MESVIVLFPGTNRERDMAAALRRVTGHEPRIVWHGETSLPDADLIVLPGGFSFGDYLRSGAIAARSPVMPEVVRRAREGALVLGVCNGFQTLCEAGLLPGVLMRNASLKFVCREVKLEVTNTQTPFTRAYRPRQVIRCPVAHADGNYFADQAMLTQLEDEGRVVFRYAEGTNPNGSQNDIAGIVNEAGNVLGMMPHPEDMT
ncbi:MAG: phosphoribosylformylglycinamidine synthase subunit PurQ, partial [Propylenella sp.]